MFVLDSMGDLECMTVNVAFPVGALEGDGRTLIVNDPVSVEAPSSLWGDGETLPLCPADKEATRVLLVEAEGEPVPDTVPELEGVNRRTEGVALGDMETPGEVVAATVLVAFPV